MPRANNNTLTTSAGATLQPTDFTIGKGEILGLTGLIGSGYEAAPYLIFGARPCRSGVLNFAEGTSIVLADMSPGRAIGLDFALLPGDRQNASGVDSLSVVDNMLLPDVDRFFRGGFLRRSTMAREARALGIQWVYYPVADVNNNPDNPIINIRSYGEDPADVSKFVSAWRCWHRGVGATDSMMHSILP